MQEAAKTHETAHPKWKAILIAEQINRRSAGILIAPWEVDQLPDEWLDAYEILTHAGAAEQRRQRMENYFVKFRQEHPTYRKYLT